MARPARKDSAICVFCGTGTGRNPAFQAAAHALGEAMAARQIGLVYGGGSSGLMGTVAQAAHAGGAPVCSVIPSALAPEAVSGKSIGTILIVESLPERKRLMTADVDGFIAMPGGFGTLDELFEVVTWAQLGIESRPIGLLNVAGYFDPLLAWIDGAVTQGFVRPHHRDLLLIDAEPASLLDRLVDHQPPDLVQ